MNDKISVIACTKGRPQQLTRMLDSLDATTGRPDLTDIWLGVDDDDKDTIALLSERTGKVPVHPYVRPHSPNLSRDYLNVMAQKAFQSADFVFVLCDDVVMKTDKWDDWLRSFSDCYLPADRLAYIGISDGTPTPPGLDFNSPPYSTFPILTRQAWKAQGFGFFHPTLLTWSTDVSLFLLWSHPLVNRAFALPQIQVEHICHHNGTAPRDATNISVARRHESQTDELNRIVTEDMPAQVQALKRLVHARKVWFCVLDERCIYDVSHKMSRKISYRAGRNGHIPLYSEYGRTDIVRQGLAVEFMRVSKSPCDTLVMLDVDMDHPSDIIERLVGRNVPVVAPLYFRRGPDYEACAFRRNGDGGLHHLATYPPGLHRMDAIGTGAIAIQRHVFDTLRSLGHEWFFKYEYQRNYISPSEDLYFCKICEEANIPMYVDTTIEVPHIGYGFVDRETRAAYEADHGVNRIAIQKEATP